MANTRIQVKRSSSTATPAGGALNAGEIAYSFSSNIFFVGTSTGDGVMPIGGKYFVERTNSAYNIAVAAFDSANASTGGSIASAFAQANAANIIAISAFTQANAAYSLATNAQSIATTAFDRGNTMGGAAFAQANTARDQANAAFDKANSANYFAYLVNANTVAAFNAANGKYSTSGGLINGDVIISGNLTLTGNTTFSNVTTFLVSDPLIYIASNNYSDILDIGFVGSYANATGANVHTGVFRDAGNKEYYVFEEYASEVHGNVINPNGNNFTIAVLNATLKTSNIILGGVNAISWIRSSYDTTNLVAGAVTTANSIAVASFGQANTANATAIAAFSQANAAFNQANAVGGAVTTANNYAIAAFNQANLVAGAVTTTNLYATSAYTQANLALTVAIAAFAKANTANAGGGGGSNNASDITSGTLAVAYGGTGANSWTTNGILYGNATGPLAITSAGTEGQVLQAGSTGIPSFAMLDGGSF
jgi:hypothetical protein